jgi:hypothetical protein
MMGIKKELLNLWAESLRQTNYGMSNLGTT